MSTNSIVAIVGAVAVVFWLASAYWTVKDARRRIDDSWLLLLAALVGLVPYLGPLVYMLFRPPEYLEDVRNIVGLSEGISALGVGERPALIASAAEFILEGLHLHQKLNKEREGGRYTYRA